MHDGGCEKNSGLGLTCMKHQKETWDNWTCSPRDIKGWIWMFCCVTELLFSVCWTDLDNHSNNLNLKTWGCFMYIMSFTKHIWLTGEQAQGVGSKAGCNFHVGERETLLFCKLQMGKPFDTVRYQHSGAGDAQLSLLVDNTPSLVNRAKIISPSRMW